jgi:probable rRNA maturation factor
VVRREAKAAGKPVAAHLAHLLIHGALHLAGYDHDEAGAARAMEQAEARLLARMKIANPWKYS